MFGDERHHGSVKRRGSVMRDLTNLGLSLADTIPLVLKGRSPILSPDRKRKTQQMNRPRRQSRFYEARHDARTVGIAVRRWTRQEKRGDMVTVGSKQRVPSNPPFLRSQGKHLPQHRK